MLCHKFTSVPEGCALRVGLFTREYPPHVYGGAGVHVAYLSRELARKISVEVHCWGQQHSDEGNLHVRSNEPWREIAEGTEERFKGALEALSLNLTQIKALHEHRRGSHPHLVCGDGRLSSQETLQHSLCPHHPQPRATARMEGGAVGHRLCDELLDGTNSDSRSGSNHRGLTRNQGRHPKVLSGRRGAHQGYL